jgi:hypothetical protein
MLETEAGGDPEKSETVAHGPTLTRASVSETPELPLLLSPNAASAAIGISATRLREAVRLGRLPAVIGGIACADHARRARRLCGEPASLPEGQPSRSQRITQARSGAARPRGRVLINWCGQCPQLAKGAGLVVARSFVTHRCVRNCERHCRGARAAGKDLMHTVG